MAETGKPDGPTPAVRDTARRLRLDHMTSEVVTAFRAEGVESILLKGASLADWLYGGDERRSYIDCDLLIRPGDEASATRVLRRLGFEPIIDEERMPEWWREHGVEWFSEEAGTIDLHRNLPGVDADDDVLWAKLSAETVAVPVGGSSAPALSLPGRAMHLALHAAQHGGSMALPDLERALTVADESTWRAAAELSEALGAGAAFAAGLRMVPAGERLAERLDLRPDQPVEVALRAGRAPAPALTLEQISRAPGIRGRMRILWRKLFPPATFMRAWSPRAADSRVGLALAYLWRPFWVLAQLPKALRAWRRARRQTSTDRGRQED